MISSPSSGSFISLKINRMFVPVYQRSSTVFFVTSNNHTETGSVLPSVRSSAVAYERPYLSVVQQKSSETVAYSQLLSAPFVSNSFVVGMYKDGASAGKMEISFEWSVTRCKHSCLNGGVCDESSGLCKCTTHYGDSDCSRQICLSDNDCDPYLLKAAWFPMNWPPSQFGPQTCSQGLCHCTLGSSRAPSIYTQMNSKLGAFCPLYGSPPSKACKGQYVLTSRSGKVSPAGLLYGSAVGYATDSICSWVIAPDDISYHNSVSFVLNLSRVDVLPATKVSSAASIEISSYPRASAQTDDWGWKLDPNLRQTLLLNSGPIEMPSTYIVPVSQIVVVLFKSGKMTPLTGFELSYTVGDAPAPSPSIPQHLKRPLSPGTYNT